MRPLHFLKPAKDFHETDEKKTSLQSEERISPKFQLLVAVTKA